MGWPAKAHAKRECPDEIDHRILQEVRRCLMPTRGWADYTRVRIILAVAPSSFGGRVRRMVEAGLIEVLRDERGYTRGLALTEKGRTANEEEA